MKNLVFIFSIILISCNSLSNKKDQKTVLA